ncbi:MAG: hypothetical protein AAGC81_01830 [Pseudomonadota bacterium]
MPLPFIVTIAINIAIALATTAIGLLFQEDPAQQRPQEFEDLENPTSGEGTVIVQTYGTITRKATHWLTYRDKSTTRVQVAA